MLGGEPLIDDASIRDFNVGIGCHIASTLEETLLLPRDMVELRGFRMSEVFLHTKRFMGMVCIYFSTGIFFYSTQHSFSFFFFKAIQSTFRLEEMSNSLAQQLDEERKRMAIAVQTLTIVENSNTDLRKRLTVEEQTRKSANTAFKGAEKQAKSQRKLTNEAKEQLATSKEQVAALKQQLEEAKKLKDQDEKARMQAEEDKAKAEKERDEAKQHGYDVGIAKIEDTQRAEVPAVPCILHSDLRRSPQSSWD